MPDRLPWIVNDVTAGDAAEVTDRAGLAIAPTEANESAAEIVSPPSRFTRRTQ